MTDDSRRSASVTVPLCLAFSVLAVFILGLLEAARYYGLEADAEEFTNLAAESLFAGYQPVLLEEYEMFFLDGSFGTGTWNIAAAEDEMNLLLYENLTAELPGKGICLYRMQMAETHVESYMLACDDNGKVFEIQAAESMKHSIGRRAAEAIKEKILDVTEEKEKCPDAEVSMKEADAALMELSEQNAGQETNDNGQEDAVKPVTEGGTETVVKENPLDVVKALKEHGVLALVLPQGKTISDRTVSVDDCLLKRKRKKGTFKNQKKAGWYERILMQEYIKKLAGNAVNAKDSGALSYGLEYIICGKGSDEENLKGTVNKLLLLREAVNFLYLQTDEAKNAEALAAAAAIAGASANPAVITVVKQGILAAWAYAESLCDIKALLGGGKIPLIKDASSFRTQLSNLGEFVKTEYTGETSGLSYENYLDVLLYGKSVRQVAYRSMDLMEWSMQMKEEYKNCRMDYMVAGLKLTAEYEANPLFFHLFAGNADNRYAFRKQAEYIYER